MMVFKLILDFLINASILVGFSAYSFLRITELYFDLPYNQNLNYFIFFGTITGYNFVKYAGVAKLHHKSLTNSLKAIQMCSFFCFLLMLYYMWQIKINTLLYTLPFVLLTVLYAIPFLSGFEKNLRQVSYLKIVIVALVWTAFTVLIPVLDAEIPLSGNVYVLLIQRFLIVLVLILPFDIRDLKYDAISLQTIPQQIGLEKTKKMGVVLMVVSLVLEYFISEQQFLKTSFMIFFFLVIIFLMRAKKEQSKYYSSFWVETLPIFWWLLLLGFHNF